MPLPLKALLGLAGASTIGGGLAGYNFGKKKEEKELGDIFDQYNQEENKQLADQAFLSGVEFALSGQDGVEKQSFYKTRVEAAFKDELEKCAGPKFDAAVKALKGLKNNPKVALAGETVKGLGQMAKRDISAMPTAGKVGLGVAGAAGIGLALKKALTNKSTAAKVMDFMKANKGKLAVGGGIGAGAAVASKIVD